MTSVFCATAEDPPEFSELFLFDLRAGLQTVVEGGGGVRGMLGYVAHALLCGAAMPSHGMSSL